MSSTLHSPEYRAFALRLIAVRKEVGLTQAELAARLGKPQSYVSKNERFERRVDPAEFRALMLALGRDPVTEYASISKTLGDDQSEGVRSTKRSSPG